MPTQHKNIILMPSQSVLSCHFIPLNIAYYTNCLIVNFLKKSMKNTTQVITVEDLWLPSIKYCLKKKSEKGDAKFVKVVPVFCSYKHKNRQHKIYELFSFDRWLLNENRNQNIISFDNNFHFYVLFSWIRILVFSRPRRIYWFVT